MPTIPVNLSMMYTASVNMLIRLSLCLCLILATGCAHLQSLQSQDLWQTDGKPLVNLSMPLLVVLSSDPLLRKKSEAAWVLTLRDRGIAAVPGYAPLPVVSDISNSTLAQLKAKHDIDALFMASLSLDSASARTLHTDLAEHLDYRMNLAFDVFVHQVEIAVVNVSAFSLEQETLLWRSVYYVPVKNGQIDWALVTRSASQDMAAAGLAKPQEQPRGEL